MTQCIGYWKTGPADDGWDDYMREMGLGFALRQISKKVSSCVEISKEEDEWSLHITTSFKNHLIKFKLDEGIEENTMDGRKVVSTFSIEGEKLIQYQKSTKPDIADSKITRERIDEDTLQVTCEAVGKNVKTVVQLKKITK